MIPGPPAIRRDEDVSSFSDGFVPPTAPPYVAEFGRASAGAKDLRKLDGPTLGADSFQTDGGRVTTFPPQGAPGLDVGPAEKGSWESTLAAFDALEATAETPNAASSTGEAPSPAEIPSGPEIASVVESYAAEASEAELAWPSEAPPEPDVAAETRLSSRGGSLTVDEALSDLEVEEPDFARTEREPGGPASEASIGKWSVNSGQPSNDVSTATWSKSQSQLQAEHASQQDRGSQRDNRSILAQLKSDPDLQAAAERRALLAKVVVISATVAAALSILFTVL